MSTTGKPERDGRGGGDEPKPETNDELFDCAGDGCVVNERASEMFNTSCDPTKITLDELRKKILCISCAVRYARRRGKTVSAVSVGDDGIPRFSRRDITAAGSGIYPLTQTLRAMRSNTAAAANGTQDDGVYACMEHGCTTSGRAQDMFNRPCDMSSTGLRELLALVCCKAHADVIAAKRGMRPGEPGSGVYLFAATLRRIQSRSGTTVAGPTTRDRHEQSYLQWYLHRPISRYAAQLAAAAVYDDGSGFRLPTPNIAPDGSHRCGLPIECCDHEGPVERFLTVAGETVGICALAAQVFTATADGMDHGDKRRHRIAPTDSPERAALMASHWLGEHGDAHHPECPACTHPKARRA